MPTLRTCRRLIGSRLRFRSSLNPKITTLPDRSAESFRVLAEAAMLTGARPANSGLRTPSRRFNKRVLVFTSANRIQLLFGVGQLMKLPSQMEESFLEHKLLRGAGKPLTLGRALPTLLGVHCRTALVVKTCGKEVFQPNVGKVTLAYKKGRLVAAGESDLRCLRRALGSISQHPRAFGRAILGDSLTE